MIQSVEKKLEDAFAARYIKTGKRAKKSQATALAAAAAASSSSSSSPQQPMGTPAPTPGRPSTSMGPGGRQMSETPSMGGGDRATPAPSGRAGSAGAPDSRGGSPATGSMLGDRAGTPGLGGGAGHPPVLPESVVTLMQHRRDLAARFAPLLASLPPSAIGVANVTGSASGGTSVFDGVPANIPLGSDGAPVSWACDPVPPPEPVPTPLLSAAAEAAGVRDPRAIHGTAPAAKPDGVGAEELHVPPPPPPPPPPPQATATATVAAAVVAGPKFGTFQPRLSK
ncbi:hypothetical protein BC828DRAFT_17378 [Blastocladiella britannica]|nr:hypothetical protein BC828DRAFT_17378 [Blastocladiella britannica]